MCSFLGGLLLGTFSVVNRVWAHLEGPAVWDKFKNEVDNKDGEGGNHSQNMLLPVETFSRNSEHSSSVVDDDELKGYNDNPDNQEGPVGTDSFEHIQLVVNLSRADHVPDLEEDELMEDKGDVARVLVSIDLSSCIPERLSIDGVFSSWIDAALVWISLQCFILWDNVLSCEHKNSHEDELVDGHVDDVLHHLS